jgi:hypothetical protein
VRQVALLLFGFLALGCASASVSENRLDVLPADAKVTLASVVMDTQGEVKAESDWIEAIKAGFQNEAEDLGIAGGTIPVEFRITRCHPGSKSQRFWVGFGAGKGYLESTVSVAGHGELQIEGSVSGGVFDGGSFGSVCEKAGRAAARAIEEARGKQE